MKLKRTTEEAAIAFSERGFKLLDEYTGVFVPMRYICTCGRESKINWNNFTKGKKCGWCGSRRIKKFTLEEVKKIFTTAECELLEDNYSNGKALMSYRCNCGNIAKIRLNDFLRGYRCAKCGILKQSGENHWKWKPDRVQHRLDQLFRKKCYKALSATLKCTGKSKVGRTSDMLGYGPKELQEHVERHPNWKKLKNKSWHLDHIFPINAFLEHGIADIKLINSLDNLRPISQRENNSKHAKYDETAFLQWLQTKGTHGVQRVSND